MKRSGIRADFVPWSDTLAQQSPDYAASHPGYEPGVFPRWPGLRQSLGALQTCQCKSSTIPYSISNIKVAASLIFRPL